MGCYHKIRLKARREFLQHTKEHEWHLMAVRCNSYSYESWIDVPPSNMEESMKIEAVPILADSLKEYYAIIYAIIVQPDTHGAESFLESSQAYAHGLSLPSSRIIAMKASGEMTVMSSYCCNDSRSLSRVTI
jgi:hypothetical protein